MSEPIRTAAQYQSALETVESLMAAELGSADGDRLDKLVTLIEAYEQRHASMHGPALGTQART